MKRTIMYAIFILCAIILGIIINDVNQVILRLNFPFELIGDWLRVLSLESNFLNVISILLFMLVGLIPIVLLAVLKLKKQAILIDWLFLIIIAVLDFLTLYFHINPALIMDRLDPLLLENLGVGDLELVQSILMNGLMYIFISIVFIYLVLRLFVKKAFKSLTIFSVLINTVIISFIFIAFTTSVIELRLSLAQVGINGYDITLFIMGFVIEVTIFILSLYLLNQLRILITGIMQKKSSQEGIVHLGRLYNSSIALMLVILSAQVLQNGYQIMFLSKIKDVSLQLDIPIFSLLTAVITFTISGYFTRMSEVEADNSLII